MEITLFEKKSSNRFAKLKVEVYLPQKLSKKTGKINGRDYRTLVLDYMKKSLPYQVELIKKRNRQGVIKYYCHVTLEESLPSTNQMLDNPFTNVMGIDTNVDGLGISIIKKDGNLLESFYLKSGELNTARSSRRLQIIGLLAKQVIALCKENGIDQIIIEDLKFKDDRLLNYKTNRKVKQFCYVKILEVLERCALRNSIIIKKVPPQYTSIIGKYKYQYRGSRIKTVHESASYVIGRRGLGYKEKVPERFIEKLIPSEQISWFLSQNEWKKWAIIDKKIKGLLKEIQNQKGGTGFKSYVSVGKRLLT